MGIFYHFADFSPLGKGQPAQLTSHSVQAAAALITKQSLIDATRKV
jgi:hypothetical protein